MRQLLPLIAGTWIALAGCSNPSSDTDAEGDFDAGREFVRAALDGDYKKASTYLFKDSMNLMLFEQQQSNYQSMPPEQKGAYKGSSIRPISIQHPNDTVTLFQYYHTANASDTTLIRIIKSEGRWLVDLKSVIKM